MTFNPHKLLRSLFMLILAAVTVGSVTAFVVVDCRPQSGKPANQTFCNGIIGGAGNNQITVDKDATVSGPFFGDGTIGVGGDDILINNGITVSNGNSTGQNGDIEGDVATGDGGNDVIVNNGTVAGDMDGDSAFGSGGSDILINNGLVDDDIDGDNASRSGGHDVIINNGMVGGDIQGDDNTNAQNSVGGDDIITINGTVEGSVYSDFGVHSGGNDTVILQNGANGGTDNTLSIDGNDGTDKLIFNFTLTDPQALDTLAAQISSANPANGSLTFNGQRFTWKNFEHLQNLLMLAGTSNTTVITIHEQTRAVIYSTNSIQAAVYCMSGGINLVGSDSQGRSEFLFGIKADKLVSALQQATANKTKVELGTADGQSLWALPTGELQLTDTAGRYDFIFSGNACGE